MGWGASCKNFAGSPDTLAEVCGLYFFCISSSCKWATYSGAVMRRWRLAERHHAVSWSSTRYMAGSVTDWSRRPTRPGRVRGRVCRRANSCWHAGADTAVQSAIRWSSTTRRHHVMTTPDHCARRAGRFDATHHQSPLPPPHRGALAPRHTSSHRHAAMINNSGRLLCIDLRLSFASRTSRPHPHSMFLGSNLGSLLTVIASWLKSGLHHDP